MQRTTYSWPLSLSAQGRSGDSSASFFDYFYMVMELAMVMFHLDGDQEHFPA